MKSEFDPRIEFIDDFILLEIGNLLTRESSLTDDDILINSTND